METAEDCPEEAGFSVSDSLDAKEEEKLEACVEAEEASVASEKTELV